MSADHGKTKKVMNAEQEQVFKEAVAGIPWGARWKKVAISHGIDRYVLDVGKFGFPYYEVTQTCVFLDDDYRVIFVMPVLDMKYEESGYYREEIAYVYKYTVGPYYSGVQALLEDTRKRGLPSFQERDWIE